MWDALTEICAREGRSLHDICSQIDRERQQSWLTAGVRVFILNYFREAATEEGHAQASQRRAGNG
jgi:predicted DNA-binding ribbon-helix-helix protein